MNWHTSTLGDILEFFKASPDGLSAKEIEARLKSFGPNSLPRLEGPSRLRRLLGQFQNVLVLILLLVATVSFLIGHLIDGFFVLFIVLVNALVAFWQEEKTTRLLESLEKELDVTAKVWRGGELIEVDRRHVVPGDIIMVSAGDKIVADARLLEASQLKVSEAVLTGEFWGVTKLVRVLSKSKHVPLSERENMVFAGTTVEEGQAKAVVVATGSKTEFARVAKLAQSQVVKKTPLQLKVKRFGQWLSVVIILSSLIILGIGLYRGLGFLEIFTLAAVLVVAAIPEGLMPVMTAVLVLGMRRILKKKGLVRRLSSAETLGGASVICLDKTGTLTQAKMKISKIIASDQDRALDIALHCSQAHPDEQGRLIGSPTDVALARSAEQGGITKHRKQLAFLPFSQEQKYLASLHPGRVFISGAPEVVTSLCSGCDLEEIEVNIKALTRQGYRVVAVAEKVLPTGQSKNFKLIPANIQGFDFAGLIALEDPLRPDTKESIKEAQKAGIRPIVVSGDHPLTVKKIASDIGLSTSVGQVVSGLELADMSDQELYDRIDQVSVFARVTPQDKLRIVQALQSKGEVVAMTGDGVNDAPALSVADVGIALASGTDVAKETADLVLLNNSFRIIVSAIREGRIILTNLKKVILYLISNSFAELILFFLALLAGLPVPLLPVQVLWINIVEGTLPDFALALEPREGDVMTKLSKRESELLSPFFKRLMLVIAISTGLSSFAFFVILLSIGSPLENARTMILATSALDGLLFAFSVRSLKSSILQRNPLKNGWLVGAVAVSFLFLTLAIHLPFFQLLLGTVSLGPLEWLMVVMAGIVDIVLIEVFKWRLIVKKYD